MTARTSFTQRIVTELAPHVPPLPCCRRALIEGMRATSPIASTVATTRLVAARVALQALHADKIPAHVERTATARRPTYRLRGVDLLGLAPSSARACCTRARVRGAFLSAGRLARPDREPNLEIGAGSHRAAASLGSDLATLGITTTLRRRRGHWLVTVRSSSQVGAALSSMGAQSGRLEFEAGRVVREVQASVNRRLNAETANLRRTAGAGVRQLEAISVLAADPLRWERLPEALREAATLRERHPDDDLASLAARAGCSRSAMAGRLRRLLATAQGTRDSVGRPRATRARATRER
jgi:WhiA C-terminal HTH domain/WhiA LAGLIDADG-like domain